MGDLPEPIRTEESLRRILEFSKRVVRINNNGLSDQRPDDDEFTRRKQKTLQASGYMFYTESEGVHIIANRHVLYNEEELRHSTFDVFYDYFHGHPDDKKLWQRSRRGEAKFSVGRCSKYDVIRVVYKVKDSMKSHIKEHCPSLQERPSHIARIQSLMSKSDPNQLPTVCLISHPLGQPKQVSFGKMIDCEVRTRTLHHNAPSKPGSSGGPVIVFPNRDDMFREPFFIYHVGTDMKTGNKTANVDSLDLSIVDASEYMIPNRENPKYPTDMPSVQEVFDKASASLEIASLAAFAPVFGAFLLQAEKTRLAELDTSVLKPCRVGLDYGCQSPNLLKPPMLEIIGKIAQAAPCFALCLSSKPNDMPDVVPLLESQGPCFCQSIVKMMERGTKLEDGTVTEYFLSPYTAAAKMSSDSDVTWPWLSRNKPDLSSFNGEEKECLMQKCLEILDRPEGIAVPAILFLMMVKANSSVRRIFLSACADFTTAASVEEETQWETIYTRIQKHRQWKQYSEERPNDAQTSSPPAREGKLKSPLTGLEEDCLWLMKDVLLLVYTCMSLFCGPSTLSLLNTRPDLNPEQTEEKNDYSTLFSRCLARSEHTVQHERQMHPDAKRSWQRDNSGNWCSCGKPTKWEIVKSLRVLLGVVEMDIACEGHKKHTHTAEVCDIVDADVYIAGFFDVFLLAVKNAAATAKPRNAGNVILAFLDKAGIPTLGRHSLMLYLAAAETFLYNCCLLAKHISKHLQPRYFAFPVSVYGRPGNWPGNVTPPEVQRTAWRLVQDAIMASGFPPAVLSALEEDAERREQLIDLYVDMKLLKWERRIQPHLFRSTVASFQSSYHIHFMTQEVPFHDATAYFVWSVGFLVCPTVIGC